MHLNGQIPRQRDGRFAPHARTEPPQELDLGDLGEFAQAGALDIANDPTFEAGLTDEQFADLVQDAPSTGADTARRARAWALANDVEDEDGFAAFAALMALPDQDMADVHAAYQAEVTRSAVRTLTSDLPPHVTEGLIVGLDRSAFGSGSQGAALRTTVMERIESLRAAGVRIDEGVEPGRGKVWRLAP